VKRPRHGVDHPPLSISEFKERVELYIHSSSVFHDRLKGDHSLVTFSSLSSTPTFLHLLARLNDSGKRPSSTGYDARRPIRKVYSRTFAHYRSDLGRVTDDLPKVPRKYIYMTVSDYLVTTTE